MNVRMLTHYSRAADGIHVVFYNAGHKYDLPDEEARLFVSIGVAVEDKDMVRAPEMKLAGTWVNDSTYPFSVLIEAPEKEKHSKRRRK